MSTKKSSSKSATKTAAPAAKVVAKKATKKVAPSAAKTTPTKKPSSAKKSAPKSASKAKTSKKPTLIHAAPEQAFWTTDGNILHNLMELSAALERMQKGVFSHHVTKERNDFAEWVEHVLADAECAAALRKAKQPAAARTVVVRFVKKYTI